MQIVISILVILFVLLGLWIMWVYNQLMRVQINRDNALADIAHDLDKLFITLDDRGEFKKLTKEATDARANAEESNQKVIAFNLLEEVIERIAEDKKTGTYLATTLSGRRYYNHATKQLNAKLKMFPSSIIGNILGYEEAPLFILDVKEKAGETPVVKRA